MRKGVFVQDNKPDIPRRVQTREHPFILQQGSNIKRERSIEWQIHQLQPVMQTMVTISSMGHLARDGQSSVSSRLSLGDSSRKLYHVARVRALKGNLYGGYSATRGRQIVFIKPTTNKNYPDTALQEFPAFGQFSFLKTIKVFIKRSSYSRLLSLYQFTHRVYKDLGKVFVCQDIGHCSKKKMYFVYT